MHHRDRAALIVCSSTGVKLELPVRGDISDALLEALKAAGAEFRDSKLGDLCAQDLVGLLRVLGDGCSRPPTAAQLKFGLDISRRLGVELPVGALHDRGIMGRFLTRYAPAVQASSESRTPSKVAGKGASTAIPRSPKRASRRPSSTPD